MLITVVTSLAIVRNSKVIIQYKLYWSIFYGLGDVMTAEKDKVIYYPIIDFNECKGCGRCITACPRQLLAFSERFNTKGTHGVEYNGTGCVGCGICFYNCPEPFAIKICSSTGDNEA